MYLNWLFTTQVVQRLNYEMDDPGNGVLFQTGAEIFSLLHSAGQRVKMATNTGTVPRLMRGDVTPFPHTSSISDVCFLTGKTVTVSTVVNIYRLSLG